MKLAHSHRLMLVAVLAVAAIAMLAGHPLIAPEALAGVSLLAVGDTDFGELTKLLQKQGEAFEEFKKANDARLEAIDKKGFAPADTVEKVNKINDDLTALGKQLDEVAKKANRPAAGGEEKGLTPEQLEHKQAFKSFLRTGDDTGLAALQRKAMNSGTDQDGGYLVLPEMDMTIDRIAPTVSAMFRLANVVTIGTAQWQKRVKTSGMAMRRTDEGEGGGETTEPKFSLLKINVFTGEVEPWVTNETLEDADINLEADLADEAAIGFAEGAGAEFITGNGVGKARGITGYTNVANASYVWGSVGYIASGKSAAFASVAPADSIIDMQHALKSQYRPGAVWMMNDSTLGAVRQMKDGSGAYYLWQPDPTGAFGGRLLGHPVEVDDNFADIGAGAYAMAFGNFKRGYTIVNRTGTTLIRDNVTTKGVTKFNFRRRFGGGISNFEAIKLMKFATS